MARSTIVENEKDIDTAMKEFEFRVEPVIEKKEEDMNELDLLQ